MDDISSLLKKVDIHEFNREFDKALKLLDQIADRIDSDTDKEISFAVYWKRGIIQKKFKNFKSSIANFVLARQLSLNSEERASALIQEGINFIQLNDTDKAFQSFNDAGNIFIELAEDHYEREYYAKGISYYSLAEKMFEFRNDKKGQKDCWRKLVTLKLKYFKDLAITSNYFNYTDDFEMAKSLSWQGLSLSLEIIDRASRLGMDIIPIVNEIKESIPKCRNALLRKKDEYHQVVELKLNELDTMFNFLTDDIPDTPAEVKLWVETHVVALEYLYPQIPPVLYVLSNEGLLIYHSERGFNNHTKLLTNDKEKAGLFAGLISAIRLIFKEEFSPLHGAINEISVGNGVILIENTPNFTVVIALTFSYPEVKGFLHDVAIELEQNYGDIISNWQGVVREIQELNKFIDNKMDNFFI